MVGLLTNVEDDGTCTVVGQQMMQIRQNLGAFILEKWTEDKCPYQMQMAYIIRKWTNRGVGPTAYRFDEMLKFYVSWPWFTDVPKKVRNILFQRKCGTWMLDKMKIFREKEHVNFNFLKPIENISRQGLILHFRSRVQRSILWNNKFFLRCWKCGLTSSWKMSCRKQGWLCSAVFPRRLGFYKKPECTSWYVV